jgi:hypothetical protein
VPLLHQWGLVFADSDADVLAMHAGMPEVMPTAAAAQDQIMQLLSFLLEHELWSCSLLVLGKHPALAAHAQRVGLRQDDDEACCSTVLDQMRRGLQPARRLSNSSTLQQMQQMPHPMQQAAMQQQQRQQCMLLQLQQQQQQMLAFQRQQPQQGGQAMWQQQQQLLLQNPIDQEQQQQQQQAQVLQQHMLLLQHMHQQQQLGMVPPAMPGSMPPMPGAAAVLAPPAPARTRSPSGSDDTVESASEILVRLGLLQQARGEQEQLQQEALEQEALEQKALAAFTAEEQDLQGLSINSMWASAAWSVPMPMALPAECVRAAKTAPLNMVQFDSMEAVGCGPMMPTAATAAATQTVEDFTGLVAHQHLAACDRRASVEQSSQTAAAQPVAVAAAAAAKSLAADGAAAAVAAHAGAVPAEAVGLRQRHPAAARTGGSLFSKQRRLSWEEEQPEPVPLAPSLSAAPYQRAANVAAAAGWYPGTWQLPEPTISLLLGQGGYARPQGFSHVQLPRPHSAAVVDCAGGQPCSYGGLTEYLGDDPYTELSYAADMSSTLPQHRQQQHEAEAKQQQQQHFLQQQEDTVQDGHEQQQEKALQLQQQQQAKEEEEVLLQQQQEEGEEVLQQLQQWVLQQQVLQQQVNEEAEELLKQQWLEQQHAEEQAGVQHTRCAASEAGLEKAPTHALELKPVSCSSKGGSCESADCSKSKSGFSSDICCSSSRSCGPSNLLLQAPVGGLSLQRPWQLLAVAACGFQDPCVEASYLVFKNHGCSMLDATAGFICTSMLLTTTLRSLNLRSDYSAWLQLMTIAIYSVFFFLPYIIMQFRLQVFLRLREQLLVFGRNTGAIVLAVMALGYLPMVQVWKNVIVSSLSLQIQNGFILPSCQQVRLPAALMIAAVHIPADAIWLAAGRPFRSALLHSVLMQLSSVTVALVFDVWCRVRFVHRYSGVTAGGLQRSSLPLQQS